MFRGKLLIEMESRLPQYVVNMVSHLLVDEDPAVVGRALSTCLRQLAPEGVRPEPGSPEEEAFLLLTRLVARPGGSGFEVARRPAWLSGRLLEALIEDFEAIREDRGLPVPCPEETPYLRTGEPVAELVRSTRFLGEASEMLARAMGTAPVTIGKVESTYIVYELAGAACGLHIDRPPFYAANGVLCLRHDKDGVGSVLRLFFADRPDASVSLKVGEIVVFEASTVPHLRTPISEGESLLLLSFGFDWAPEGDLS